MQFESGAGLHLARLPAPVGVSQVLVQRCILRALIDSKLADGVISQTVYNYLNVDNVFCGVPLQCEMGIVVIE